MKSATEQHVHSVLQINQHILECLVLCWLVCKVTEELRTCVLLKGSWPLTYILKLYRVSRLEEVTCRRSLERRSRLYISSRTLVPSFMPPSSCLLFHRQPVNNKPDVLGLGTGSSITRGQAGANPPLVCLNATALWLHNGINKGSAHKSFWLCIHWTVQSMDLVSMTSSIVPSGFGLLYGRIMFWADLIWADAP